jgi:hypothetical protein
MTSHSPEGTQDPIEVLRDKLRQFAAERDWDQFHSPKNLAMALSVEAAELLEHLLMCSSISFVSPTNLILTSRPQQPTS